jgi:hypothetical protein
VFNYGSVVEGAPAVPVVKPGTPFCVEPFMPVLIYGKTPLALIGVPLMMLAWIRFWAEVSFYCGFFAGD